MHTLYHRFLSGLLALGLTLGSFRGYLALFEDEAEEPRQVYPCPIASLPTADRYLLERRIPVRSEKELQHLLEDYLS